MNEFVQTVIQPGQDVRYLLYHLYSAVMFGLMIWAFHLLLKSTGWRRFSVVIFFVVILVSPLTSVFMHHLEEFPSITIAVNSLFLVTCSLMLFWEMLHTPDDKPLSRQAIFWFNASVLVYWSIFFFKFALFNPLLYASEVYPMWIEGVHVWVTAIYYFALGISIRLNSLEYTTERGHDR